jgi:hypothetical protein
MITRKFWLPALAMMSGAVLVVGNNPAHAFNMTTRLQGIYRSVSRRPWQWDTRSSRART